MTETTAKKKLPAAVERFVLHWGDMGDEWGVNRSVSQIHGLLYLSEAPITADDIAETLGMARSNVSNSIRELLSWNLIRRVPIMGDRRDHYEAETDIWEVAARRLDWATPWHTVLDWSNPPFSKWFVGGTLNAAYNCVDRHVLAGRGDKVAYFWEGEPGDSRTITYSNLLEEVCKASNALDCSCSGTVERSCCSSAGRRLGSTT